MPFDPAPVRPFGALVYRMGILGSAFGPTGEALRQGLKELGYVEGRNIGFEYRWAEGEVQRHPSLAAELVSLKVDVILTAGPPAARAAKQATTTIPIVTVASDDPVGQGLVASLARDLYLPCKWRGERCHP